MSRLLLLLGIGLFTAGAQMSCSSDGTGSIRDDDLDSGDGTRFTTRLILRDSAGAETYTFDRSELITLELTIRNHTDRPVTLESCCPPDSDFFVFEEDSRRLLWKWSLGRAFPAVITDLEFAAGETRTFRATWNQVSNAGETIPPGDYLARGAGPFVQLQGNPLSPGEQASGLRAFRVR
jgi:hypothetical protein